MNKMKTGLAAGALLGAALVPVAVAGPAEAGWLCTISGGTQCGDLRHGSPDAGDDRPILATCDLGNPWAAAQWVPEGREATCHDTDGFWVEYGTFLTCTFSGDGYGTVRFDHNGQWRKINDGGNFNCKVGAS